jgi:hypothetical protein
VLTVLGSSDEASALTNEVTDLQVVLNDVRSILEGSKKAETDSLKSALPNLIKVSSYFTTLRARLVKNF